MIKFENVTKTYEGGFQAVKSVNFEIKEGELLVLIGPSGSGKSTTMKMINRIIPHTSGTVSIDDKDIKSYKASELRRNIGYVIQQIGLFPHYTIEKNIAIVPQLKGWDEKDIQPRVKELLELVGLDPKIHATRYPKELSGGQQQRVGIARALASNPDIILMDEPFSALDPITREQLQAELLTLHKKLKKTIVFVTHDMDEALKMGDRIAIMKDGKLLQLDTPEKLLHEPAHGFVEEFIGKHRIIQNPELMPVTEIMSETIVTSPPQRSPERALALIRQRKITNLVILSDDKKLLGIVSAYDLLKQFDVIDTIDDIMVPAKLVLLDTATAKDAIVMIDEAPFGMIPVVDSDQKIVGLVTRGSLLSAMSSQWTETEEDTIE
ncbi:betaine/proline/choline family ABC transporter ATP-binding protein [Sporosarcina pasteurii]|uniref:Quaternary amine transport ATP-binding protein n=1 Tax=Sporosarcina pasteurii TaxID=1474 RepID=A0A380BIH5_SPOPA|nr:betaine/proline/choline family ABC transporter ATP-binding protein [Sporosarcina pasteurii]MDS9470754.1 betaine/proline/choline family ABC transporter ATP-binding protein [Sporosarcina pasteurii]QBQ05571.1 ATP-binding cassette domain-containing protein [Sporosarcina pasteurii]SUJ01874.1 Glycine betaine/L-proline transport ATP-binding protein ProV [Sporosarcina pasteurii]